MGAVLLDFFGRRALLTDEGWAHIVGRRPYMADFRPEIAETLGGRRKSGGLAPSRKLPVFITSGTMEPPSATRGWAWWSKFCPPRLSW